MNLNRLLSESRKALAVIPESKDVKAAKFAFLNTGGFGQLKKPNARMSSYELLTGGQGKKAMSSPLSLAGLVSPKEKQDDRLKRVLSITENGLMSTIWDKIEAQKRQEFKDRMSRLGK